MDVMSIINIINNIDFEKIGLVLALIVNIVFVIVIQKYMKELKNAQNLVKDKERESSEVGKFFSQIPDEKYATPARGVCCAGGTEGEEEGIFAGTVFDLCLKGLVSIDVNSDNNINISLNDVSEKNCLTGDEKIIYGLLVKAIGNNDSISLKNLKKYAEVPENAKDICHRVEAMTKSAYDYTQRIDILNTKEKKMIKTYRKHLETYIMVIFSMFCLSCLETEEGYIIFKILLKSMLYCPFLYIGIGIGTYVSEEIVRMLKRPGNYSKISKQWNSFRWYLIKYSEANSTQDKTKNIDIKKIEKYLVYAVSFNISLFFMKELDKVYPGIFENYTDQNNGDRYDKFWREICMTKIGNRNTFKQIESELHKVYNKASKVYLEESQKIKK